MTKGSNSDIQAVILCGSGHALDPINDEDSSPTCLLPVANRPLLYYPITWLQQSGVSDIFIVAHKNLHSRLTQFVRLHVLEGGNHITLVELEDLGTGTMDALRTVRPYLTNDFILLSCDLITEFPLYKLVDQHRTSDSLVTVLLAASPASTGKGDDADRYRDCEEDHVYAGMDESRKKLFYLVAKDDLDDTVDFKMSLLTRFSYIVLRTNLTDAHCYIFRKEIWDVLDSEKYHGRRSFLSVREDLIPRLVKDQKLSPPWPIASAAFSRSANQCAVRLVDDEFCIRVNNLKKYYEANRFVIRSIPFGAPKVSASAEVHQKSQIGNDSMVGDFSRVGEKTSVKRSIVGINVIVGKNVKISNCIIMDKVVIEDNCKLDGCIISHCVTVREKSSLKDCDIGANFHIPAESTLKGESLRIGRDVL